MSEMLVLASRNLKFLNREMAYLKEERDEDYLANACFYTYKVIEFTLKYLLEARRLPFSFTCEIKILVKMCLGYEIAIPDEVLKYYIEMKDWHTEPIYDGEFKGSYEIIAELHPILNNWVQELLSRSM